MSSTRTPQSTVDIGATNMKRVSSTSLIGRDRHALDVVVDDVTYIVTKAKTKNEKIALLKNVSCAFVHGKVHALMGASGAGKTTLLDVMTTRVTAGEVLGNGVRFGGMPATKALFKTCAAYVEQFDTLLPMLTVQETLNYWAELRARTAEETTEILARVPQIINDLDLTTCKDVIVGDALNRGISGGQAKRTNVALALVTDPDVLFLDEPTSGLDSATSLGIVQMLKNLADSGVTVIATIHSPTSEAFRLFDSLVMLKSGQVAFAGPLNTAVPYLKSLGFAYDDSFNMADFLIATVASEDLDFVQTFKNDAAGQRNVENIKSVMSTKALPPPPQPEVTRGALSKIKTLLKYRTRYNYSNPDFVAARSAGNFLFGFVMMSLFWKIGKPTGEAQDQSTQLNVASLLSMLNILPSFQASGYMPSVVLERAMFYRELDDGVYPLVSYIAYKIIEEGILAIPVSLIAQMMLFLGCGIQGSFFYFWIINYGVMSCGIALAYVCAAAASTMDEANTLLPVYNVVQLLFSGIIIRVESMPKGWAWYRHTLFVRYGWMAQMRNHFKDAPAVFFNDAGEAVDVGDFYGVSNTLTENILAVFGLWLFWIGVAYFTMKYVRHQKR
jgi:ATP-binding cassette, subfamily G (WHITE), member 2